MSAIKAQYQVPAELQGCHTAIVDGYVIEGHVPAAEIYRLLDEKPDIIGLTVLGMPVGSPGMEMGSRVDLFDVMLLMRRETSMCLQVTLNRKRIFTTAKEASKKHFYESSY